MKRLCSFFLLFAICSTTFAQSSVAPQQDENAIYTVKVLGAGYSRKHSTRDTSVPRSGAYGVKVSDFYDTKTLDKWLDFYVSQVYRLRQDSTGTMEADYLLECTINNMYKVEWKYMAEHAIYKKNPETKKLEKVGTKKVEEKEGRATVELTFTLTNRKTQEQFTYSSQGSTTSMGMLEFASTLNAAKKVIPFLNSHFPVHAKIVSIDKASKKALKRLHLNVGSYYRITDKTHFEVYTPNDMEKPIAKLNVKTVDGENSCLCTVTSGGKAFKAAYDAGTQFVVRTRGY